MNTIIKESDYDDYLEIGIDSGQTFSQINCKNKTSVDNNPDSNADYMTTSDLFFELAYSKTLLFDIIFIDGNHDYEYVKRDIKNSLRHLRPSGIIFTHDTLPRHISETHSDGSRGMGTAYKGIMDLRMNNPDVVICSLDLANYPDVDEGVGVSVIIKGAQSCYESLDLNWSNYQKHKHKLMNILPFTDFKEWFNVNL